MFCILCFKFLKLGNFLCNKLLVINFDYDKSSHFVYNKLYNTGHFI